MNAQADKIDKTDKADKILMRLIRLPDDKIDLQSSLRKLLSCNVLNNLRQIDDDADF